MSAMVHHVPIYSTNGNTVASSATGAMAVPSGAVVVTSNGGGGSFIQLATVGGGGPGVQQQPASMPMTAIQQASLDGGFQTALTAAPMVSYCTLTQAGLAQQQPHPYQPHMAAQQQQHPHHLQHPQHPHQHQVQLAASIKHDPAISTNTSEFLGNIQGGGGGGPIPYQLIAGSNGQTYMIRGDQLHLISQQPQLLAQLIDSHQQQPPPLHVPPQAQQTHVIMANVAPAAASLPLPPGPTKLEACGSSDPMVIKPAPAQPMVIAAVTSAESSANPANLKPPVAQAGASANEELGAAPSSAKKKILPTISTGRRCLKTEKVNNEELARRAKRRERNRVAAAKCRKKRQDQIECLTDEASGLEADNSELEAEIARLLDKKSQLMCLLQYHQLECPEAEANLVIPSLPTISAVEPASRQSQQQQQQRHQQTPTPPSLRSDTPPNAGDDIAESNDDVIETATGKPPYKVVPTSRQEDFDPDHSIAEPESFTVILNAPATPNHLQQQQQQQRQQASQQSTLLPPLHSIVSSLPSLSFASSSSAGGSVSGGHSVLQQQQQLPGEDQQQQQQQQIPPDLAPLFALKQETFLHL